MGRSWGSECLEGPLTETRAGLQVSSEEILCRKDSGRAVLSELGHREWLPEDKWEVTLASWRHTQHCGWFAGSALGSVTADALQSLPVPTLLRSSAAAGMGGLTFVIEGDSLFGVHAHSSGALPSPHRGTCVLRARCWCGLVLSKGPTSSPRSSDHTYTQPCAVCEAVGGLQAAPSPGAPTLAELNEERNSVGEAVVVLCGPGLSEALLALCLTG